MEINKIYNEDCLNALSKIPDNSIDCVITDPHTERKQLLEMVGWLEKEVM